jgi:hypothetical protein
MSSAPGEPWVRRDGHAAAESTLEVAIPFRDLGVSAGQRLRFFVVVSDRLDRETARSPEGPPIEIRVPGAEFEGRTWRV